ncbi:LysE family translocator [Bordetella sp. FB-8]|uniref:LysE family translocator n=1 Tax=Bordetella sp. FB-8 TaxID=1159870 RepID=UPI000477C402|nr:LysE family translocator [Bordetella sp. FB-8]
MISASTLILFSAASLALLLSPGPNMAFVVSHGAAQGSRAGLAAALGIGLADLIYTALTAAGLAAAIAAWPPAFDLIRYVGAIYLLWLARQTLRQCAKSEPGGTPASQPALRIFVRSAVNSLLNPKAMLFYMVFLPQFVEPARGHVPLQIVILGCLLAAASLIFHALLGVLSASTRKLLNAGAGKLGSRAQAVVFALLALRLALLSKST